MHGLTKFQSGIDNIAGWFTSIGLPGGLAYGVATVELVGGLLLILGLGVRYIGLLFAMSYGWSDCESKMVSWFVRRREKSWI